MRLLGSVMIHECCCYKTVAPPPHAHLAVPLGMLPFGSPPFCLPPPPAAAACPTSTSRFFTTFLPRTRLRRRMRSLARCGQSLACGCAGL